MERNNVDHETSQSEPGNESYDYQARSYDPALARFTTIDPLAEKHPDASPYAYCADNPINRIDQNGMDWAKDLTNHVFYNKDWNEKNIPKGYTYVGTTVDLIDQKGNYQYGSSNGNLFDSHPLDEVTVNGDKDYKFHHSWEYNLLGDFRNSDGGYAPWSPQNVNLGVFFSGSVMHLNLDLELGLKLSPGQLSSYGTFSFGLIKSFIPDLGMGVTAGFSDSKSSSNKSWSLGTSFGDMGFNVSGNVTNLKYNDAIISCPSSINSANISFGVKSFIPNISSKKSNDSVLYSITGEKILMEN